MYYESEKVNTCEKKKLVNMFRMNVSKLWMK